MATAKKAAAPRKTGSASKKVTLKRPAAPAKPTGFFAGFLDVIFGKR